MVVDSLLAGLVFGPLIGLAATLAMDLVMGRLPEGKTPPRVAAGVLTETPVDDAPRRLATWVHYVAGAGSGLLFLALATLASTLLPLGTVPALAVAGVVMVALMVGFFVLVPLPRARGLARQRVDRVRTDWTVMAVVYVLVASALVAAVGSVG